MTLLNGSLKQMYLKIKKCLKQFKNIIASVGILWRTFAEWRGEDWFVDVHCLV
jgi:hypothetical protein